MTDKLWLPRAYTKTVHTQEAKVGCWKVPAIQSTYLPLHDCSYRYSVHNYRLPTPPGATTSS